MSHTQAPWIAEPWTCHAATTVTVPDATAVTGKRIVAECETEANALLIAAAPELLAALKLLLPIAANAYGALSKDLDQARAAIAKATGGAA